MIRVERIQLLGAIFLLFLNVLFGGGYKLPEWNEPVFPAAIDTIPLKDRSGNFTQDRDKNPFDLKDPNVVDQKIEYDPVTGQYIVTEKVGDETYRPSSYMTFTEFLNFKARQQDQEYYKDLAGISTPQREKASIIDPITKIDLKKNLADRLFGGFEIDIKPQGSIAFTIGANYSFTDNPLLQDFQRRQITPNFDMDIRMDVTGNIGDKLKLNTNYDTKAAFDFENKLKLAYDSEKFSEDDIIKKVEAGNVSLPLRTNLIQGSQNLFGFKTEWQFGYLRLTGLISQQKSKQEDIQTKGGGVIQEFEKRPDEFDENRHFFLSHYNRNTYETALAKLPEINSQFKLKDIEVWITEDAQNSRETDFRDIVALNDLGLSASELDLFDMGPDTASRFVPGRAVSTDKAGNFIPSNTSNTLLDQILANDQARDLNKVVRILSDPNGLNLKQGRDFEKVRARKLNSNEYSYNAELGFISLRSRPRPNQVLAVAYNYLHGGRSIDPRTGAEFKIGELSSEVKSDSLSYKVIFVKMLKSSNQATDLPSYRLMMKNVYPTGGYNLNPEEFTMDIYYEDQDGKPKRFIQEIEGYPLLNLFNLDFLNKTNDPQPDGVFDFVPGQTVIPASGAIIFPVLEPFGSSLKKFLGNIEELRNNPQKLEAVYNKYKYEELYDNSITAARRELKSNQFLIRGTYKSGKSNEIPLNTFNLDPNARVIVSAGSLTLNEGTDYIVDRNLGKVTILNEALLQSGVPISVKFEDNALFSFQTKTMIGLRAEYSKRKDLSIGATYMHLFEKPFTEKVNIGEDPINNRIIGLDFNVKRKAPWLTRALDKLPLYSTKEASSWALQAEAAALIPGHSNAIEQEGSEGGVVYIDDFEGSSSGIGLGFNVTQWILASAPQGLGDNAFRGTNIYDNVISNANRALLSWYRIDEFARSGSINRNNPYCRLVDEREIFPNKQRPIGFSTELTFDMTYYPREKGPYNYDIHGGLSAIDPSDGSEIKTFGTDLNNGLLQPKERWAGIMTRLTTNDFEANNVEYIDFWMLNPFLAKPNPNDQKITNSGKIYLQLGNFSEDIFKDGKQQFEHGLPTQSLNLPIDNSVFGKISRVPPLTSSFDINERAQQDLGYDGLSSDPTNNNEATVFANYIAAQQPFLTTQAFQALTQDPSNDNYISYRSNSFTGQETVLDKYKRYNMPEGNGQIETGNNQSTAYTGYPDQEDLNNDKSLNEIESYYSYELPIDRTANDEIAFDPTNANNYITDTVIVQVPGSSQNETWYRFRIPVNSTRLTVGQIRDFRSIQAMRLLFTGFDESVTFRFIKFQLGRNSWRKFQEVCEGVDGDKPMILDKVDIEENSGKTPFNYTTPPGIQRERFYSTQYADIQQNEASLLVRKENLIHNCEVSIYKIIDLDIRKYKRLKMFVHGESLKSKDLNSVCVFMRLGKDFTDNYYEYEIPLRYSNELFFNQRDSIWPKDNEFDFPLQLFVDLKNERNNRGISFDDIFSMPDPEKPGKLVKIKGNPTIGLVRGIQLGIRNKSDSMNVEDVEVWFNELRLTGLEEKGGFAALARAEIQLADLGNLSVAGNYSTIGWGGIDKKLDDRAKDEIKQIDATMNISLDKFIPESTGIRIPFSMQYSVATRTPEYDPNDTDIKLKDKLEKASSDAARDSIRDRAIDYVEIKSFAFNNVRKERRGTAKAKPWDIENFSLSYAQSVTTKTNPIVSNDELKSQQGALDYNFSLTPKYIEPFKNSVNNANLRFIKEINFNFLPNSFSVRNSLERKTSVRTYRFAAPKYSTWEDRKFSWNRDYSLTWDFTRSLKFNFSAKNESIIDEITFNPLRQEYVDPRTGQAVSQDQQSSYLWNNVKDFGRTKDYKHNFTLAYSVPMRLIPYLDFITLRGQYTANYNWAAGSLNSVDSLGSVISNGQNISVTNEFNMTTLYNKIPFLKKYAGDSPAANRFRPAVRSKDDATKEEDGKKKKKESSSEANTAIKIALTPVLMLKRIQLNYSQNKSTTIPGFMRKPEVLGLSSGFNAPGFDFITGVQPDFKENGWLDRAAEKGWISTNCFFNREMTQRNSNTFSAKIKLEPVKEFNIDVNFDRNYTRDHAETFKYDQIFGTTDSAFQHFTPFENGQYTVSYVSLQSLFSDIDEVFDRFSKSRTVISKRVADRLGVKNLSPSNPEYYDGYAGDHIEVVAPAFLASYTNQDPNTFNLNLFETFPLPNWQVNYSGLSRIGFMKDIFRDFSIRHAYKNTLTVNSFKTNLSYRENDQELPIARRGNELKASYHAKYEVPELVINEQFAPLMGINIKTNGGLELGFDYNKNRNLKLQNSLEGQLLETKASNYTIKAAYIIKDVFLSWLPGMKALNKDVKITKKKSKKNTTDDQNTASSPKGNDLEFSFDFGITDNVTKIHRLDNNIDAQNISGSKQISFTPAIKYSMNKNLNIRFFVDYRKTIPYVQNQYKDVRINGGLTIKYTL
jgi:cell surface protein SprA